LFKNCQTIKERSDIIREQFDEIVFGDEDRLFEMRLIRWWEGEFYNMIEVEDSPGWNYLHEHNWDVIKKEVIKLTRDRWKIVRCLHSFAFCYLS